MIKKLFLLLATSFVTICANAQVIDTTNYFGGKKPEPEVNVIAPPQDDENIAKDDIIKKGLSFGPLPIVAYDQDRGFEYGALLNIYNFGDGSWYPTPQSTWYFEISRYTKGSQLYVVSYDNRVLIPGVRISAAINVVKEKALDFYGFNGYESYYDVEMPTAFYRLERLVPTFKVDFMGKIRENLYWKVGYHFSWFDINNFESETLNETPTLFELYKSWGIIPEEDADGGFSSAIRFGIMYDSRDFEAAPSRGIWAEIHAVFAPEFLGTSHGYTKLNFTFRHYVPIVNSKLVFAYRLNYQGFVGSAPFYVIPYSTIVGPGYDRDGFGGYHTVRGIMRDRIQGMGVGFYNAELRWRFLNFHIAKQNVTLALSGFTDGAKVLKGVDMSTIPTSYIAEYNKYINSNGDNFHLTAGGGFRIIINQNFIIAAEYGKAFNNQDHSKGALYINTGFLF